MKYSPFRRVGEPASFKGIKGPYLFRAMYYSAGAILAILITFVLPLNITVQLAFIVIGISWWLFQINELKKKSKSGDIFQLDKDRCRRRINIKSDKL